MDTSITLGQLLGIVGIFAIVFIAVYLVQLLKNASQTMKKVNKLLDDNTENVTNIVKNADSMVSDAKTAVDDVKSNVIEPVKGAVGKFTSVVSRLNQLGDSQVARREKKLKKATKRAQRQAKKEAKKAS